MLTTNSCLNGIRDGRTDNPSAEVLVEDIKDISRWFQLCCFERYQCSCRDREAKLSRLASIDEEWAPAIP